MKRVRIFDTTLRDGEQSPGVSLTMAEKLEIGRQLARLRVDVIEAGYAAASPGDFASVQTLAKELRDVSVCSLARALEGDIERAYEAVRPAADPRIHVFIATSDVHMRHKLRMTREQVLEQIGRSVRHAAKLAPSIEFSPEDGGRTDPDFLALAVQTAIKAGATVINIPDTVGYLLPSEFGARLRRLREQVDFGSVQLSAHCHDDLGLAVANTLAAIEAGADQVEVTINGIGERAGNAALEEIAVALRLRQEMYGAETRLDLGQIVRTSQLVSRLTGMVVPPNKAVVGANAFAHESGIHQDGVIKERTTYEIIDPDMVGLTENKQLVLGKHSGRNAFRRHLEGLGYAPEEPEFQELFGRFKELCDRKKSVTDDDIVALLDDRFHRSDNPAFTLDFLHVSCGSFGLATATVKVTGPAGTVQEAVVAGGGVEAMYQALDSVTGVRPELASYTIAAVTSGPDALGEVRVQLRTGGSSRVFSGKSACIDVLEASARAYLDAVNKLVAAGQPDGRG